MSHPRALSWSVGELPFIWKPLSTPHNPVGLPDTLPFSLGIRERTGVFIQEPNARVTSALARAYSLGSAITGQMAEAGIGRGYADDFLAFIERQPTGANLNGRRILEVGCGTGYLLHRLAERGAVVLGIEPGDHRMPEYAIPIIRDFFPSSQLTGPFDTILGFAILEHVEDPAQFLEQLFSYLAPGGEVLLGVPDCGPYLDAGDLSCLFHEHWSYFDHRTLASTLRLAGADEVEVCAGRFGGMLYARVTLQDVRNGPRADSCEVDDGRLAAFRAAAEQSIDAISRYLGEAARRHESVGVYVPSRIVNTLFAGRIQTKGCRFFDDNPLMKGTYFPGLAIPIEDRADLIANPTDRVLIMSRSFGDAIASKLSSFLPPDVMITKWEQLFESRPHPQA